MKTLKSKAILKLFTVLLLAISIGFISSCKKSSDDGTPAVNKTALGDSITSAQALVDNAVEGVAAGNYVNGSKAILQATIDAVKDVYNSPTATQASITAASANLASAVALFKTKVVVPIAQSNLIAQWTFSEGTGTTVNDASPNHLNGTFMEGHAVIVGHGPLPQWTADRYGTPNKALHFIKGGHIEVPYNTVLIPAQITISLWANVDSIFADNYMLSLNWWECYKFQFQSANKAFFTFKNAVPDYFDRDWSVGGLATGEWHHIAVTVKDGEEDFYADGVLVKSWTDVSGGLNAPPHPQALCIGQQQPNTLVGITGTDDPSAGGSTGYFKGSLDDIRIYNIALTGTQIQGIYDLEKAK